MAVRRLNRLKVGSLELDRVQAETRTVVNALVDDNKRVVIDSQVDGFSLGDPVTPTKLLERRVTPDELPSTRRKCLANVSLSVNANTGSGDLDVWLVVDGKSTNKFRRYVQSAALNAFIGASWVVEVSPVTQKIEVYVQRVSGTAFAGFGTSEYLNLTVFG